MLLSQHLQPAVHFPIRTPSVEHRRSNFISIRFLLSPSPCDSYKGRIWQPRRPRPPQSRLGVKLNCSSCFLELPFIALETLTRTSRCWCQPGQSNPALEMDTYTLVALNALSNPLQFIVVHVVDISKDPNLISCF